MTSEQVAALGPAFTDYLGGFRSCFSTKNTFAHLGTYCRGLISDLPRKSVEPIAIAAGAAVRTLQEFLTHHVWDHDGLLGRLQRRVVEQHLPPPGQPAADGLGVVGLIDETSVAKKGNKTPGVQRQYCGALGKVENCIVTVHLAVRHGSFLAMLDSDLFLPEESWDLDRERCKAAHVPDFVTYRPKWVIALEQLDRAAANGVRFDWLTFDEWYGAQARVPVPTGRARPALRRRGAGQLHVLAEPAQVPLAAAPFAAKRADNAAGWGKPFRDQDWHTVQLDRQTLAPQTWKVKAAQVYLQRDGRPTDRTYWLIVARNVDTGEVKYFVSNAPPHTKLATLLKVAFCRWGVEHAFRLAKTEIGFGHFEGRSWKGLLRHMILCQVVMLFVAEQTDRLRGEKTEPDDGANRPRLEHRLPALAAVPPQVIGARARRLGHPLPPGEKSGRQTLAAKGSAKGRVAL